MIDKIKNFDYKAAFNWVRDVRNLGLMTFVVIVLLVSWSGVKVIQTNYVLEKQISQLQQENAVQKLANDNLKLKNEYYNTPEFLELAARRQFGKAAPGETLVIVPKSVALAHTVDVNLPDKTETAKKAVVLSKDQQNFQAWLDFFFHHGTNN